MLLSVLLVSSMYALFVGHTLPLLAVLLNSVISFCNRLRLLAYLFRFLYRIALFLSQNNCTVILFQPDCYKLLGSRNRNQFWRKVWRLQIGDRKLHFDFTCKNKPIFYLFLKLISHET